LAWQDSDELFFAMDSPDLKGSAKIASFDLDGTLVEPKSGKKFPTGRTDWEWWNEVVPTKLKSLHEDGFKIVIFTNQMGIEKGKQRKGDLTGKMIDIANELGFPIQAFIAGGENVYRKPSPLMWETMVSKFNHGVEIDMVASFYCGDAAGRKKDWKKGKKKDFSCGDRKFAANVGVKFFTPEELFLEEKGVDESDIDWEAINPVSFISGIPKDKKLDENGIVSEKQEMVIMVGPPASGKSTLTKKFFEPKGYIRINRDTLGTQAKCKKAVKEAFTEGLSVVVDNTNGSSSTRAEYVAIAQEQGVPVRCFLMSTSQEVADHLNYVRVRETKGDVRRIPDVAYRTYDKYYEEPEMSEGFNEVRKIEFIPDFRADPEFEKMWKQWT